MKRRTEETLDLVDFHALNRGAAGEPRDAEDSADISAEPIPVRGHIRGALSSAFRKLIGRSPDSSRGGTGAA